MMPPPSSNQSGITVSDSGERHIPSSKRADGTVRREIKVRPGYKPPEDVEVYKNRTAEAWKGRKNGGIPGAELLSSTGTGTSVASKNAKRREARKRAAATATKVLETQESDILVCDSIGKAKFVEEDSAEKARKRAIEIGSPTSLPIANGTTAAQENDAEKDDEKNARKLAKKLRQAKELKDRKEKGDALLPEQLEKVIRISEITRQLEGLGFDANGDKKHDT